MIRCCKSFEALEQVEYWAMHDADYGIENDDEESGFVEAQFQVQKILGVGIYSLTPSPHDSETKCK